MTEHFKLAGPDIVHENFGGEIVVLNLISGQYFGLNGSGATVWQSVVAGYSVADIAQDGLHARAVVDFVEKLQHFDLIVPDSKTAPAEARIAPITEVPTIEVYDDLADLIVADPIHDVDEKMGWPTLPDGQ